MDIKQKLVVSVSGMLILSVACFSQSRDSLNLPRRVETYAADKFAVTRPLNIEFTYSTPYNFTSEQQGKSLPESKVTGYTQLKMSANYNFIKRKSWMLGLAAGYRRTSIEGDIAPLSGSIKNVNDEFHYLYSSVNLTYFSKLFNKRTIYTSSLLVDGSERYFERVKGLVTASMILKANQRTKLIVGVLVNIDPSAQTPFMPTIAYEHKFNNGYIADITFPRSLYLRKLVHTNGRLSLGTEIDRPSFYLYNLDSTAQKYEYRQFDLNSGLVYEHILTKYLLLTVKTGMKITPSGRIFRKEDSFADPVYETKPDPAFYFNIGVSFNPFTLLGAKN
ncbi:DUF6268 family outer membrane beta-barrel protein [Chitinophaga ginsengisoli]|uniref:DUF6268 domain-containing protein n=1 Tax=Chitinophaga ginsengisoli TaxID=363837 RepID=A0A2P8G0Q8_9BACT|nr:DUF6268 family outer membrane beta-barrel protein [Chitinophaga ginsengisoli]PSL27556.1 hypothetical protein CLV42_10990 [Chitinophaga ginsengisoli]